MSNINRVESVIKTSGFLLDSIRKNTGGTVPTSDLTNVTKWKIFTETNDPEGAFEDIRDCLDDVEVYALYDPDDWEDQLGVYFYNNGTYEVHWGDGGERW